MEGLVRRRIDFMKLKYRNGSTLALTLIVFAVLMIFGTFILGFMVTENKQAMYHQNKTQAYYIARSGAEVVEAALNEQLQEHKMDLTKQKEIIDQYDDPGKEINIDLEYIDDPVLVKNEYMPNGRRVLTITSKATYRDISQIVKKVMYSEYSSNIGGLIPPSGQLFLYLGDQYPQEYKKNNNGQRNIPPDYVSKVKEEDRGLYKKEQFSTINDWTVPNDIIIAGELRGGNYQDVNKILVDGNLIMDGDIYFTGDVDIYIKGTLYIKNGTRIIGDKKNNGIDNKLNIYVYNQNNEPVAVEDESYGVNSNNGNIFIVANIYVDNGNIFLGLSGSSRIDGHIIYNGDGEVHIKTNSNGKERVITGSIYAPFGAVHLGINSYQLAASVSGQIIGDSISVYVNNPGKGDDFYKNSSRDRINSPIPISTEEIDLGSLKYNSFYVDINH